MKALTMTLALIVASGCSSSRDGSTDGGGGGGTDSATPSDWASCENNLQCGVAPASCCGSCGAATPGDMVGVNVMRAAEQNAEACAPMHPGCPECFMQPDPFLVATCNAGTCNALDLRADMLTACSADTDCVLATPSCCDCGSHTTETAIAVNNTMSTRLRTLICDLDGPACPPCVPSFDGIEAFCNAGRCDVQTLPMP